LSDDYGGLISEYDAAISSKIEETPLKIMVLGPNTAATNSGAELRKFIIEKCRAYAVTIMGEHEKLIAVYRKKLGAGGHLCSHELTLATTVVDAIIIIPASPGSFVELGMFANVGDVCRRTLVLFNQDYVDEKKPTFIHLGPKVAYQNQGATVEFVNYSEKERVWEIVDRFVQIYKGNKFTKAILGS
jgi:hypothetical protein